MVLDAGMGVIVQASRMMTFVEWESAEESRRMDSFRIR